MAKNQAHQVRCRCRRNPRRKAIELRDTVVPGFLCKITPAGRKVFMLQYRTNSGERRKPALGQFGELTVEQARVVAQDWLAEVRRGGDPSALRPTPARRRRSKELCRTVHGGLLQAAQQAQHAARLSGRSSTAASSRSSAARRCRR